MVLFGPTFQDNAHEHLPILRPESGLVKGAHDACVQKAQVGLEALKTCVTDAVVQSKKYDEVKDRIGGLVVDSSIPKDQVLPAIKDAWSLGAKNRSIAHPITDAEFSAMSDLYRGAGLTAEEMRKTEKDYGIDSALVSGETQGWRAASPGTQTIRLLFDRPQTLRRIALVFEETEIERTQEFALRWSPDGGCSFREIVRQHWNFSPPETIREVEDYRVEISDATVLELVIVPDISRGAARASLKSLRLT